MPEQKVEIDNVNAEGAYLAVEIALEVDAYLETVFIVVEVEVDD